MSQHRTQKTKLKKDPHRRHSSTLWLQRQVNDPFVQMAKREGYRARSVYKLKEIDERFSLIGHGLRVADLGAAPGSWSQYAARKDAKIAAVDLLEMQPIQGVEIIQGDFMDIDVQNRLHQILGGPIDLVMSDIAPDSTGQRAVDRLRAEAVGEMVIAFANDTIAPNGQVLIKMVKGAEAKVMEMAKQSFDVTRILRPKATRAESSEIFMLVSRPKQPIG